MQIWNYENKETNTTMLVNVSAILRISLRTILSACVYHLLTFGSFLNLKCSIAFDLAL